MWFHDLIAHKGYADAELLNVVWQHRAAAAGDVQRLLHHMLVANRFWLLSMAGEPFDADVETRAPASLGSLIASFRTTYEREAAWVAHATDAELSRTLESPLIPGGRCTVAEALIQVCLHSQGHRAQCAKMLRAAGGSPPATDFIQWRLNRAAPMWPRG